MISVSCDEKLRQLGGPLRDARLRPNETQREFTVRLEVSIPMLRKMETGESSVSLGGWVEALDLLDYLSHIDHLLSVRQSLFGQYDDSKKESPPTGITKEGFVIRTLVHICPPDSDTLLCSERVTGSADSRKAMRGVLRYTSGGRTTPPCTLWPPINCRFKSTSSPRIDPAVFTRSLKMPCPMTGASDC